MRFATRDQTGSRKIKIAFAVLLLILMIVVIGSFIRDYDRRIWQGIGRFSVLDIKNKEIKSVDPETGEAVRIVIPATLEINTLEGRGKWSIAAIEEKKSVYGYRWMENSIGDYLGIMGLVSIENFSLVDKVSWYLLNRSARYRDIDLDKTVYVSNKKAIDETEILGLGAIWEASVREYFVSYELANEKLELEVVNTTELSGLAGRVARLLDVVGISVNKVESLPDMQIEGCLIKIKRELEKIRTVEYISKSWECGVELNDSGSNILYLGDKLAERFKLAD